MWTGDDYFFRNDLYSESLQSLSYRLEQCSWMQKRVQDCKPFKLLKLPLLALMPVIRSMQPVERFKLSLSSNRMQKIVKTAKTRLTFATIVLNNDETIIECKEDEDEFYLECSVMGYRIVRTERCERILLLKQGSIAVNTARGFEKLIGAFKIINYGIAIREEEINTPVLSDLLSNPMFKDWITFTIDGITLKTEDLNLVMERADPNKGLEITNCKIPEDFKHENAFKFGNNDYNDALWVSYEDLMKIGPVRNVTLGKSNFSSEELKVFLKHVVDSDVDLLEWIMIGVNPGVVFDDLFEGMVVLEYIYPWSSLSFTLSPSKAKTRKFTIMAIHQAPQSLTISSWIAEEPFKGDFGKSGEQKQKHTMAILRMLDERARLLKKVEEEDLVVDRQEIQRLTKKMEELNVVFKDGRATVQSFY